MDGFDHIRARQIQQVVITLQIRRMVAKTLPTEIFFRKLVPLYHGTHCPVYYQDAFFKFFSNVHSLCSWQWPVCCFQSGISAAKNCKLPTQTCKLNSLISKSRVVC